ELLTAFDTASTDALTLAGNDLVNTIRGNAGANLLNGGEGADTLEGLGGDDRYIVDDSADVVVEVAGQGYDIVYTTANYTLGAGISVEVLSALDSSTSFALNLTGNELDNGVYGNNGANILDGGAGADRMVGF